MFDALKKKLSAAKTQVSDMSEELMSHIKVSEEVRTERLDVCKTCDQFHKSEFCKLCGCYMPAKSWLPHSSCPMKKWLPIQISKE